jgi:LysR family nitrogen assimilation transcriptional regulator
MALYRHACGILRQIEQVRQDVKQGGVGESGRVAIGLPTSTARVLAIPLLKRIRAEHPGIYLKFLKA